MLTKVLMGSALDNCSQVKVIPSAKNAGTIVQYIGETTADYHNGYFYQSYKTGTESSTAIISQSHGTGLNSLSVTKATFETKISKNGNYRFKCVRDLEHIDALIGEDSVRLDRNPEADVDDVFAWVSVSGEIVNYYTESATPVLDDEIYSDPYGETEVGTVEYYTEEQLVWEHKGIEVDLGDYGITFTPAEATATVTSSSPDLGTVTVNSETFSGKVIDAGSYIFDAVVHEAYIDVLVGEAPEEGEPDERPVKRFWYEYGGGEYPDVFEAWKDEEDNYVYTQYPDPSENAEVYSAPDTHYGNVQSSFAGSTKWYLGQNEVTLNEYGISYTGTAKDGNTIHIYYETEAPHVGDEILVVYTASYDTFGWQRVNVQPSDAVAGAVNTVNNIEPTSGNIVISGANINATVDGETETITSHLSTIKADLGDLGDDVSGIQSKIPSAPAEDGVYVLTCTVTSGNAVYTWTSK